MGTEAVSLALLAHLWNGVYVNNVPDNPGPVAHTREAMGTMQYPYGCPSLRTLPSFQAGHYWQGQKRDCKVSYCSPVSEAQPRCPGQSHWELGIGGSREASLLQGPKFFLPPSWWTPPRATALHPIPYCQVEGTYLGAWLSRISSRSSVTRVSPRSLRAREESKLP